MRKLMLKISKFAPAVLLAAGVLVAGEARAQRECSKDPAITGRVCTEAVCIALQDLVDLNCKTPPAPRGCYKEFGCAARQAMKQRWLDCRESRVNIRTACWPAGDPGGHDVQITQIDTVLAQCERAIQEKVTNGGCNDPCPQN